MRNLSASVISQRRRKARRISAVLHSIYRSPTHQNKADPLDELIFIILSQMTTYRSFERVFDRLKLAAPNWEDVRTMPVNRLKRIIKDAGLSNQKAPRIKAILKKIHKDFGTLTLEPLRHMSTFRSEAYLKALPGVQAKTAKCVLMYSLHRKVLPVDTHVLRVARRIGLTNQKLISEKAHHQLELAVAPVDRYRFHVNAIAFGREVCLAKNPRCPTCPIRRMCDYYCNQPLTP
jgi:endonuclease III